jgi:hypothetical protein
LPKIKSKANGAANNTKNSWNVFLIVFFIVDLPYNRGKNNLPDLILTELNIDKK